MSNLVDFALRYASKGMSVFPCHISKRPLTPNGFKDATTDPEQIRAWWTEYPNASIGYALNGNCWALDVDLPAGPVTLAKLEETHGKLPLTRTQRTGSGGTHYFFKLPTDGRIIKNSAKKIGPGLDTRAQGGYVILAPSPHESGHNYEWVENIPSADCPEWIVDLLDSKPDKATYEPRACQASSPYGQAALDAECQAILLSGEGSRNQALNTAAFSVGQLVAGGELDENEAKSKLLSAALQIGLGEIESVKTMQSGIKSGMREPRKAPQEEKKNRNFRNFRNPSELSDLDGTVPELEWNLPGTSGTFSETQEQRFSGNLMGEIREFIYRNSGTFTVRDLDAELGIKDALIKKTRSKRLHDLVKESIIRKDSNRSGVFHILSDDFEVFDLDAEAPEDFPLELPLGLSELVDIPVKGIILLSGVTSAGKTAVCLNVAALNRNREFPVLYCMSEMCLGAYKKRLRSFGEPLENWKSIQAGVRTSGFDVTINGRNPDGLTIVDYLEETDGEYYKMASKMREIYDALNNGVAWVCLQKASGSLYGRGGQAVNEKPILVLNLDVLVNCTDGNICAIRIQKGKYPKDENRSVDGLEMHFKIRRGSQLELLLDTWQRMDDNKRKVQISKYEQMANGKDERPW